MLVVIVIIGILATISTATFKSYFGKARDAERQSAVQNMSLMIKVDGADDWSASKFMYAPAELQALFDENDFRVPKGTNNICYLIGMANGATNEITVGDGNEFAVMTWGESMSTSDSGNSGVIVDGTTAFVDAIKGITVDRGGDAVDGQMDVTDFACGNEAVPADGTNKLDANSDVADALDLIITAEDYLSDAYYVGISEAGKIGSANGAVGHDLYVAP
ncbi:type II secretion system GspH family protein [Candidatus Gracilibacteria bacterium]|nr:type II secretion system GspH family protein [Candidatus Gracilibacteria bacterium]